MSDQCQHSGPHGQCHHPSVDGSDFCGRHSNETERIHGYRITNPELRELVEYHSDKVSLQSVRNEILMLKAMINDRLELAQTPAERIAAFQSVTPTLASVVKCFETLAKLERQYDVVVGKEALHQLGQDIVVILSEELEGIEGSVLDRIAARIADAIADAHNQE